MYCYQQYHKIIYKDYMQYIIFHINDRTLPKTLNLLHSLKNVCRLYEDIQDVVKRKINAIS